MLSISYRRELLISGESLHKNCYTPKLGENCVLKGNRRMRSKYTHLGETEGSTGRQLL